MSGLKIGVLHPGAMGESLAARAKNTGHQVYWASAGRSHQTRLRAKEHDLQGAGPLRASLEFAQSSLACAPLTLRRRSRAKC